MHRIFISYKRVDKEQVIKIKNQIESSLKEKCWIDTDGIESDAQFKNVIIGAINKCEVVLFMYSKAHTRIFDFEKDWTVRELNFASKKNKRIVFVNLDGSNLTDTFEFDYGSKQQVDGRSDEARTRLIKDLSQWLNIEENKLYHTSDVNEETLTEENKIHTKLVQTEFTDSNWFARLIFIIDVSCVIFWGYFFYHRCWLVVSGITSFTYITNIIPVLFRLMFSIQLFRNEKYAYVSYIFFLISLLPLVLNGYGYDSFASLIFRPFEYFYLLFYGKLYRGDATYIEVRNVTGSILCLLFCIFPLIAYVIKANRKLLKHTTKSVFSFITYFKGDPLVWYVLIIFISICWSYNINTSYTFPKMLFYTLANASIIIATRSLTESRNINFKIIYIIILLNTLFLTGTPVSTILLTLITAYYIYKGTSSYILALVYHIVYGYIVPFILFQEAVVGYILK